MTPMHWVCVLAGGDGKRLASHTSTLYDDGRPKQFCALHGPQTMIEQTLRRTSLIVPANQTLVSMCQKHMRWRDLLLGYRGLRLSVQPQNAGTGPGVLLATMQIAEWSPDAIIALQPSDHYVADDLRWVAALREAYSWVEDHPEYIVMLGVNATYPETEYGWLKPDPRATDRPPPWPVRFVEKPAIESATRLFEQGAMWNTMAMVYHSQTMLKLMEQEVPHWFYAMRDVQRRRWVHLPRLYELFGSFDLSRDILEACADHIYALPTRGTGWSDLGNPRRLRDVIERHSPQLQGPSTPTVGLSDDELPQSEPSAVMAAPFADYPKEHKV